MANMSIYLTNLGKYNEGYLIGEWVKLPVSQEELTKVMDRIGINEEYEEYFITDYECDVEGVEVGEYSNLDELNEIAEQVEDLDEYGQKAIQAMLLDGYKFAEALEKVNNGDYMVYSDCDDMSDVACQMVEESGMLSGVSDNIARYFDYEAYGRDLDIEGKFYNIDGDYIDIL